MAAQQFKMIFQPFNSSSMAEGSSMQISRAFPTCQVQSLDARGVQLPRILGGAPHFFPAPSGTGSGFSLHAYDSIISSFLDDLPVKAGCPKDSFHHLSIKLEAISCDQWNQGLSHSGENILEEEKRVPITPLSNHSRRLEPLPDFDCSEDPNRRLCLTGNHRANLINLQFTNSDFGNCLLVEATTPYSSLLQAAVHRVPSNLFRSGNGRFASSLDTQSSNLVKSCAPMLEPIIKGTEVLAKSPATTFASEFSAFSPSGLVKSETNNHGGTGLGSREAVGVGTTEQCHGMGTRSSADLPISKVDLKPKHVNTL